MISNLMRRGDPRLARLMRAVRPVPGFVGAVDGQSGTKEPLVEVIVLLNRDARPAIFADFEWHTIAERMYTVVLAQDRLRDLLECPDVDMVYPPEPVHAAIDDSMQHLKLPAVHQGQPLSRKGRRVIVGIIDFGFDLTLDDFQKSNGETRLLYFWDQTQKRRPGYPAPFGYGVQYDAKKINAALKGQTAEMLRHHPEPGAHGTHVAGIAAGNGRSHDSTYPAGRFIGAAPDAKLIFVHLALRRGQTEEGEATFEDLTSSMRVVEALTYIFEKADEEDAACVINLSVSQNSGGHDGLSPVELAIDRLVTAKSGRAVVVAAGNYGDAGIHARWEYDAGASTELSWVIPAVSEDVRPDSWDLHMWYPSRDTIRVSLAAPNGETAAAVIPPADTELKLAGTPVRLSSLRFVSPGGDSRIFISVGDPGAGVMPGTWTVRLEALAESHHGFLDAWIERTADRVARAYFEGAGVTTSGTLGSPATSRYGITVGNINHRTSRVEDSSGRGPTRDAREKPEIVAPGVNIRSSGAMAGTRTQPHGPVEPVRVAKYGSSMSAPHITGIIACMFEEERQLTAPQIQKILVAAANGSGYDEAAGFGLVDATLALQFVTEYVRSQRSRSSAST